MAFGIWGVSLLVCAIFGLAVTVFAYKDVFLPSAKAQPREIRHLQATFLPVFYLSMLADWLQGPYVYVLYAAYGYSREAIGMLFVTGFASSMVFGVFAGAVADASGRKFCCQLYCIFATLSCLMKHVSVFEVLLLGRVLAGISTSLLFSAFESWMISEHNFRGFSKPALTETFSLMYFGSGLMAILAGLMAEGVADVGELTPLRAEGSTWQVYYGGYCAPFDLAAVVLLVALALLTALWGENQGRRWMTAVGDEELLSPSEHVPTLKQLLLSDSRIALCGGVVTFFEASLYIFVFNWTPALMRAVAKSHPELSYGDHPPEVPFGTVFSTFMLCCMAGASFYQVASQYSRFSNLEMLIGVFLIACMALCLAAFQAAASVQWLLFPAFLLFEVCVGFYWPAIGAAKSSLVPEQARATIYNIYRVPLNIIVLVALLTSMETTTAFLCCTILLALAIACQAVLAGFSTSSKSAEAGAVQLAAGES